VQEARGGQDIIALRNEVLQSRTESGTSARQNDVPNPNGYEYGWSVLHSLFRFYTPGLKPESRDWRFKSEGYTAVPRLPSTYAGSPLGGNSPSGGTSALDGSRGGNHLDDRSVVVHYRVRQKPIFTSFFHIPLRSGELGKDCSHDISFQIAEELYESNVGGVFPLT